MTGKFWEGCFHSDIILDPKSAIAVSAYIDLNPIKAKMADELEGSDFTSIQEKLLQNGKHSFLSDFNPCYAQVSFPTINISQENYAQLVRKCANELISKGAYSFSEIKNKVLKSFNNIFKICENWIGSKPELQAVAFALKNSRYSRRYLY